MTSTSMTKRQVFDLLTFLKDVYPNLEVTQSKIDTWTKLLSNQDAAKVMKKAEFYAVDNKFPPTIADLTERNIEARRSDFLEKAKQWERDAVDKP